MSLLVIGTVAFDDIETPFGRAEKIVGGAATYISLTASYFTNDVGIVAVVGDDFPADVIADMQSRGIRTEGLQIKEGEKSFFWAGKYHLDMNTRDTLVTDLNVLADFDPKVPDSYQPVDFVMLGNLQPSVQINVIEQLSPRPKLIAMDTMNFWMDVAREELDKAISMVDVLIINDEEARQYTEEYSLVKAAKKIMTTADLQYLVIKKGEHGALLFHSNDVFFAPALPLEEVFDPTGAGDTFAGGFMGYLAKTNDVSFSSMKRAVIFGSAMASFCVEKFGTTRLLDLSDDDIDSRIQEFVDLVQFDIELVG